MKKGLFFTLAAMFCCQVLTYAQDAADQSIRKFLDMERQATAARDSSAFFALLNESPNFSLITVGNGYYIPYNLQTLRSTLASAWKQPRTNGNTYKYSDLKSKVAGDQAIAEFVSTTIDSNNKPIWQTLETWTMSKNNGAWKIDRMLSVDTSSFNPAKALSDTGLEDGMNMAGYQFLAAKKNEQAIRVFKLNTELFPKAWNTYDSLAEAYMVQGNKKEAIANYQHSLKLNPQNENGKKMLDKLKSGK